MCEQCSRLMGEARPCEFPVCRVHCSKRFSALSDLDLTVGGAVEVETTDFSVAAAAVEFESALFTVE